MSVAPAFPRLNVLQLKAILEGADAPLLVDVLPPEIFAQAHIPGAKNACVYEVVFADHMAGITTDTTRKIVVYGAGAGSLDVLSAAEKLHHMGFANVLVFEGGAPEWHAAGYALEGSDPRPQPFETVFSCEEEARWTVEPQKSRLEWWGRNANSTHHGTVDIISGHLATRGGMLQGAVGLDMTSIRNLDLAGDELQPVLEGHLRSDDFFFTKVFPAAELVLDICTPLSPASPTLPTFLLSGMLTLRGVRKALEFPATVSLLGDGGLGLEAHFDLDRTKWGVLYGSTRFFKHLSYHLVFDLISVQVRLTAQRE